MNALIYKAVQHLVMENHDPDTWDEIVAKAHATSRAETAFQRVSGSGIAHLIDVAAAKLESAPEEMLSQAGQHWVTRNQAQVAERMRRANGASFADAGEKGMLQFQNGIGMVFPAMRPPVMLWQIESDSRARLRYVWHRDAFGAFVHGLLLGLANCFDERLQITSIPHAQGRFTMHPASDFVAELPKAA